MTIYRVSLIGHRRIDNQLDLEEKLHKIVVELLRSKEYVEFYIGRNGEFDIIAASVIKRAQKIVDNNNSSVVLVLPYKVKDMEYYENSTTVLNYVICVLNHYRSKFIETKNKIYWYQMIQLLPSSYNQKRTIQLNYAVLRAMYHARVTHKLDEWRVFCNWIASLPYSELITM